MTQATQAPGGKAPFVLAFDTANEVIAVGVGALDAQARTVEVVGTREVAAHRASNTQLLPQIDGLLQELGIARSDLACVACGRGPGSFTGVRICMATAKGVASALEIGLFGVSTLDAIAWQAHGAGLRGTLLVVADAMRKEVYPMRFSLEEAGVVRLEADTVAKAEDAAAHAVGRGIDFVAGDALIKYGDLFVKAGAFTDEALWTPTGRGLLLAFQAAWRTGAVDPFDAALGNPAYALPVYTRLSDAEENERIRASKNEPKNLQTGVQEEGLRRDQRPVAHDPAIANAQPDEHGITYRPLDAAHAAQVAALEDALFGCDALSAAQVLDGGRPPACQSASLLGAMSAESMLDELRQKDHIWWAAYCNPATSLADAHEAHEEPTGSNGGLELIGYAGGKVVDGQLRILKIAVVPAFRRQGIASNLLALLAQDARDLGANEASWEVGASDSAVQAFCQYHGLEATNSSPSSFLGSEGSLTMAGPLPVAAKDVAGMRLEVHDTVKAQVPDAKRPEVQVASCDAPDAERPGAQGTTKPEPAPLIPLSGRRPFILAIETSCDETAAAVIDGEGELLSDVVASQIDFHARFGGVVPEIASRKHIEAICGVTEVCLEVAAAKLEVPRLRWKDLDAVAVTYAPGLVGALVVGVAFAKGAAWAAELPFIGVNHLEGHLYANKIADPDITPPMVVSLVSGGNTMLVHVKGWGHYVTLGETLDDAVGEAFDKVSKAMGLGYPGGPAISKAALTGDPQAIDFPRAMLHSGDLSFSLSGLKTAVVTYIANEEKAGRPISKEDVAASFQQAVIDVQIAKAETALKQTGAPAFCLGGGVAANAALREAYQHLCARLDVNLTLPPLYACTDNAGMIALVALDRFKASNFYTLDADAYAHADLDLPY